MSDTPVRTQADETTTAQGKKKSASGRVYNALDKLERAARVLAKINRLVMGDPDPKSKRNKKRRKKIKKYAKIDQRRGVLVLKKEDKIKKLKKARPAKRYKKKRI